MKKAKSKANKQTKECRRNRGLKIFNAKEDKRCKRMMFFKYLNDKEVHF